MRHAAPRSSVCKSMTCSRDFPRMCSFPGQAVPIPGLGNGFRGKANMGEAAGVERFQRVRPHQSFLRLGQPLHATLTAHHLEGIHLSHKLAGDGIGAGPVHQGLPPCHRDGQAMTQARGSANDSGAKYQLAVGSIKSPHRVAHATTVFRRPACPPLPPRLVGHDTIVMLGEARRCRWRGAT